MFPLKEESLILYCNKEELNVKPIPLSIVIAYLKLKANYIDILPKELQMIIMEYINRKDLRAYMSIVTTNIQDLDYKFVVSMYHQKIIIDINYVIQKYPEVTSIFTWREIYAFIKCNIDYLYFEENILDMTKYDIMRPLNPNSSHISKIKEEIQNRTFKLDSDSLNFLFFSFRVKFLFPEFYAKTSSFYELWGFNFTEYILTFRALYVICYDDIDAAFIKAIANDFPKAGVNGRLFPSERDGSIGTIQSKPYNSRIANICSCPSFLWYIINNHKVAWGNTAAFYTSHYEILECLSESKIYNVLWLEKITNVYLRYLIGIITTNVSNTYLRKIYKLTTSSTFELLINETIKRGINF